MTAYGAAASFVHTKGGKSPPSFLCEKILKKEKRTYIHQENARKEREMQIVEKNIRDIKPYKKNPRKNDAAVPYVQNSIKTFGFKVPIVIDGGGEIVAGHTRYKAALNLGMETVPCIIADDLTPEQIKAFRLADNRTAELAQWDFELLDGELADILEIDMSEFGFETVEEEDDPDPDEYDADLARPEARTKPGDIYLLGNHRVMCGNSTKAADVARLMGGEVADLVVTDPPYNVDYSSKNESLNLVDKGNRIQADIVNDRMSAADFVQFLTGAFSNMLESLKNGGAFYIWTPPGADAYHFETALHNNGVGIRQKLIWVKNNFVLGRQDYQNKFEPCLYGWKEGAGHYFRDTRSEKTVLEDYTAEDIKKLKKADLVKILDQIFSENAPADVIHEEKPQKSELHPTMKPVPLFGRLIRNSSRPKENVLDLFGGSGTTIIACEQLGRRAYVMEYDPHYVDIIIDRWEKFTGKKAVLLNG